MAKMKVEKAVQIQKDMRDANMLLRNWLHSATPEQKELVQNAFGGREKIAWGHLERALRQVLEGSEMMADRLSSVLESTEVDV